MGRGDKHEVQFVLPDPEPQQQDLTVHDEEFIETPYTSILMSTASGDGYASQISVCCV